MILLQIKARKYFLMALSCLSFTSQYSAAMKVLKEYYKPRDFRCILEMEVATQLSFPLMLRLLAHNLIDVVDYIDDDNPVQKLRRTNVRAILKSGKTVPGNFCDQKSFRNVIINSDPPSTNAKRKLKNIVHSFARLDEYWQRNRLLISQEDGSFHVNDDYKKVFAPDLADYFAGIEPAVIKCAAITRLNYRP